jgi:hypothetical protein
MTRNAPVLPAPIEVDLDDFYVARDHRFRLWLCFENDARIALDFVAGSDEHQAILDTLTSIAIERLGRLGSEGVAVTGLVDDSDPDTWTRKH